MDNYDPQKWYWKIGADAARVFSGATGDYVAVNSAAYLAWVARGNSPTQIGTEAELGAVLAPHAVRPSHAGVLDSYKRTQATSITIKVVAKLLYLIINRLLVLEGKPTVTPPQFENYVKDQM